MKRDNNRIILTLKEAEEIMNLLYTLEATSGAYDEKYTKDAQLAGRYGNKLFKYINKKEKENNRSLMFPIERQFLGRGKSTEPDNKEY